MATEPAPQRVYRAACPNCGAPVEFRSAASAFAVCSFCQSTLVRDGDALRRVGRSAELFDDHSPLQLGVAGRYQGSRFSLVGRLQYRYAEGTWNEWHALFDGGKSGWLSEDNGRYVIAFDAPLPGPVPEFAGLRVAGTLRLAGQEWSVASVADATLLAAAGELPHPPNLGGSFEVVDLRNARGEVGTLDGADPAAPRWSIGRSVGLAELALTGLGEAAEKALHGQTLACPNCGAALVVKLASTRTIVCTQCHSVVDVSQGVGGELAHYGQDNGLAPLIPLGSVGTLALGAAPLPWQVVGYVERMELPVHEDGNENGNEDAEDGEARSFWREYLLYNRGTGFAFLVDAQDGWSWTVPLTGVPRRAGSGVELDGVVYRKLYDYAGVVTYVLGEFYWQVTREQRTLNTDYQGTGAAGGRRLNRERTTGSGTAEEIWSGGETLDAEVVRSTFRLAPVPAAAFQRDALPTAFDRSSLLAKIFFWLLVGIVVLAVVRCSSGGGATARCSEARNTFGAASAEYQNCLASERSGRAGGYGSIGGAFGGFSSGGSHK